MAQLKSTVVQGSLRVTDTTYTTDLNISNITASKIAKIDANKNLTSGDLAASEIPNLSTDKLTSGILGVARGGTGAASFTANSVIISGSTTTAALTTRSITNNTTATAVTASTNIITANTLYYHKGNSNIVTVGTITSGTWQGTAIAASYIGEHSTDKLTSGTLPIARGGTGIATTDAHKVLIGPSSGTTAAAPTWRVIASADLPAATSSAIGAVSVSTGLSVTTAGALSVVYGTGASKAVQGNQTLVTLNGSNKTAASLASFYAPTTVGTSGQYLKSSGSGAPTWDDPKVSISANVTTDEQYAIPFVTTGNSGTSPTAAKIEGLQKNTTKLYFNPNSGRLDATMVANAIWNDYAECRSALIEEPGRVITESKDGKMRLAEERLMPACKIISDTYGTIMGQSKEAKTPIAVAGRVLAYPYQNREVYELGAAVCSAPNGTVDIMTRDEIREYPERILGTVSEIPNYDIWFAGNENNPKHIPVNGRIWIYVR